MRAPLAGDKEDAQKKESKKPVLPRLRLYSHTEQPIHRYTFLTNVSSRSCIRMHNLSGPRKGLRQRVRTAQLFSVSRPFRQTAIRDQQQLICKTMGNLRRARRSSTRRWRSPLTLRACRNPFPGISLLSSSATLWGCSHPCVSRPVVLTGAKAVTTPWTGRGTTGCRAKRHPPTMQHTRHLLQQLRM